MIHKHEGDLRELHNDEGEYIGIFAPVFIWLEITKGKEAGHYILNKFSAIGYSSDSQAEEMRERIRNYGSVNLSKWTKVRKDNRSFEERYLENMAYAERCEREEGLYS
jgi:hypothetical protein